MFNILWRMLCLVVGLAFPAITWALISAALPIDFDGYDALRITEAWVALVLIVSLTRIAK